MFYRVGTEPVDAVIRGRCHVYPPGTVVWFDQLPAALIGLVVPLPAGPPPPRRSRDDYAAPAIPAMETKT